jgi:TonB family protein/competence ComEA-like helix-hairpin-helix protein
MALLLPPRARAARPLVAVLAGGTLAVALAAAPAAQPGPDACFARLADARDRYLTGQYEEVEELLGACLATRALPDGVMTEGYRMLTLAFIRRDLLAGAQETVVKHLAWSFAYEPDEVQDPPVYVALVRAIKQQLTVRPPAAAGAGPPPARVNLNDATAAELAALDGVGALLAARVVEHRRRHGPFADVGALGAVPGIDPDRLARLQPLLTVDEDDGLVLQPALPLTGGPGGVPGPPPEPARGAEPVEVAEVAPELIGGLRALQELVEYPEMERRAGISGRVFLRFVVHEDGTVSDIEVLLGATPGLDRAAADAVRRLRFIPGQVGGLPVKARTTLRVSFLANRAGSP